MPSVQARRPGMRLAPASAAGCTGGMSTACMARSCLRRVVLEAFGGVADASRAKRADRDESNDMAVDIAGRSHRHFAGCT